MKANELRIGNLVKDSFMAGGVRIPCQTKLVGEIGLLHVQLYDVDEPIACQECHGNYDITLLEPIPLTEEWLLKAGFEHHPDQEIWNNNDLLFCLSYSERYEGFTLYVNHEYEQGKPFKYVHQFQNLYFALTGTELEIKP